jgi:hypothetical protein
MRKVNGQLHALATLTSGKDLADTHWIKSWIGPRANLDVMVKRKMHRAPVVQPIT